MYIYILYSWQRDANPPYFMKNSPILLAFFLKLCPTPFSLSPPTPTATALSVVLLLLLNG